jgi:hypothetical protein
MDEQEPKTLAEAVEMLAKARREARFWRAVADLLHAESTFLRKLLASAKRKSA